jgi:hypothetical protein
MEYNKGRHQESVKCLVKRNRIEAHEAGLYQPTSLGTSYAAVNAVAVRVGIVLEKRDIAFGSERGKIVPRSVYVAPKWLCEVVRDTVALAALLSNKSTFTVASCAGVVGLVKEAVCSTTLQAQLAGLLQLKLCTAKRQVAVLRNKEHGEDHADWASNSDVIWRWLMGKPTRGHTLPCRVKPPPLGEADD